MKLYEIHTSWINTSKEFIYNKRQGIHSVESSNVIALTIRVIR